MTNNSQPTDRAELLRRATLASVLTASLLILVKLATWIATGSVSLLATLIDSCLDALASLTNLVAVRYALRPADQEHRFGHGKLESLAGLAQSLLVGVSGLMLVREAIFRVLDPQPMVNTNLGLGVMVFAMITTGLLLRFQRRVIQATGSSAIKADYLHYSTDLAANGAVLVALVGYQLFDWERLDPLFALGIAGYVLYSAGEIAWEAVQLLMDRELPEADRQLIQHLALTHSDVLGVGDLKTRRSGTDTFIQLELKLSGQASLEEAHQVTERVERDIKKHFANADVHIHQEPVSPSASGIASSAETHL